ncbi:MAG: hypothetical protein M3373_03470 [Gemmatimonadota bacterium]|nr:hypothetical protein [Gemmatimonadota bacterium]
MGLDTVELAMDTEATFSTRQVTVLAIRALELARELDDALYAHEQVRGQTARSGVSSRESSG